MWKINQADFSEIGIISAIQQKKLMISASNTRYSTVTRFVCLTSSSLYNVRVLS